MTVTLLRQMFADRNDYIKHMSVLRTFLELLHDRLLDMDKNSIEYRNQYPLFDTINQFVGSVQCICKERQLGIERI